MAKIISILAVCMFGVSIDPFFFYIPFIRDSEKCIGLDKKLWIVLVALRSVADLVFFTAQYHNAQGFKKMDQQTNTLYLWLYFLRFAFILAPIPQIYFSKIRSGFDLVLFCYYVIRVVAIFRLCEQLKKKISVRKLVWFNVFVYSYLYMIVGHMIGGFWYYLSIERQRACWNVACKNDSGCVQGMFSCDGKSRLNSTIVNDFCPINPSYATVFQYGIYLDAFRYRIMEGKQISTKFLRCFWWGLRNLSSFGSNLQSSADDGETAFAITIFVIGLILVIYLIGNIQKYAVLASARSERIGAKMKIIKSEIKFLVKNQKLPTNIETEIERHIQNSLENDKESFDLESLHINHHYTDMGNYDQQSILEDLRSLETRVLNLKPDILGKAKLWLMENDIPLEDDILFCLKFRLEDEQDVNLKRILSVLSEKLQCYAKSLLCFDTLKKVPRLEHVNEEWFQNSCGKLKPVIYPNDSYIIRKDEPLDFIIIITNGIAWTFTTSTDADGIVSTRTNCLQKGDFFGEQLLEWKVNEKSLSNIPISTTNVKCHTQVEALVFMAQDIALSFDFPLPATVEVDSTSQTQEITSI